MKKTALAWLLSALFLAYLGGCMGINLLILRFFEACKNSLQSSSIEFMYADKDF